MLQVNTCATRTLGELVSHRAYLSPANLAICAPARRPMCYGELQRQITTIAAGLNAMGIGRNSRVALVLPNGPEMASAFLAVASCATCAPLNPSYTADDFAFYLDDLGVDALIVLAGIDSPARTIAQHLKIQILELRVNDQDPAGSFTIINTEGFSDNGSVEYAHPDDVALVLHTSGTTGRPKQVRLTHANLCASAANVAATLRLTPDDRCLNIMPLFHIHGLVAAVLASIAAGGSVACTPGITGGSFFDWLGELRPTWFTGVPTMHQHILACAGEQSEVIRRNPLRLIRSASAPLSPALMADLERCFDAPVIEAYGMTEAAHQIASNPLPPGLRRPGSVGLAAGPDVAVMNDTGQLLAAGSTGEIVVRGANVTQGYANNPKANDEAFRAGWLHTGDQGYIDAAGYVFLIGRLKENINRGGAKVSPREVDDALQAHPAVIQAVTFRVPHTTLGEDVAAAVVLRHDAQATVDDIRAFLFGRLAESKIPSQIVIVEKIPTGPSGKIERMGLAEAFAKQLKPAFVAPRNDIELALAAIFSEILGAGKIGVHDNFFALGGDSLRAVQALSRIRTWLGANLTILDLFKGPSVEQIAREVDRLRAVEQKSPALKRVHINGIGEVAPQMPPSEADLGALPDPTLPIDETSQQAVVAQVLKWARSAPERIAVSAASRQWTYAELTERAMALAVTLMQAGIKRGDVVAIIAPRGFGIVGAMLGVLMSGGAFLTIDPALPAQRKKVMLDEARAKVVCPIGQPADDECHILEGDARIVIRTESDMLLDIGLYNYSDHSCLPPDIHEDDPAYVFFTSGSTGRPKAILGCHKGLSHFLHWQSDAFAIGPDDRVSQLTGLGFDPLLRDVFLPLTSGATLCVPAESDLLDPIAWIKREGVTVVHSTPTLVQSWLIDGEQQHDLPLLRWLFIAGEPLTDVLIAKWRRLVKGPAQLVNLYGPTETTMACCFHIIPAQVRPGVQPIGLPLPQTQALVLNAARFLCGPGETGEIVLRTPYRSLGYLNLPEENNSRFRPNPFRDDPTDLVYFSGDLGRYRTDGLLEIIGRLDDQVKIRGVRIDPGEVTATLSRHEAVRDCVVVGSEDTHGHQQLVGYVVAEPGKPLDTHHLRKYLTEQLPQAFVPSKFMFLEKLPMLPNGKVNRKALPAPQYAHDALGSASIPPRNALEALISGVWCEVLKLDQVGVHDNFFELGGHSLLAVHVIARLVRLLKIELPMRGVFDAPTVAALAEETQKTLGSGNARDTTSIVPVTRDRNLQLSYAQQRLWFLERLLPDKAVYNIAKAWRLLGRLDVPALQRSLNALVARHESLRTRVALREDEPIQVIDSPCAVLLSLSDLSTLEPGERDAQARQRIDAEAAEIFDLEHGPIFRAQLLRVGAEDHLLLLTVHHIASDGWSVGVFNRELSVAYAAFATGREPGLPALPIQYADYAVWQREWLQGEALRGQLAYWKEQLADLSTLELPTDRPRPLVDSFHGGHLDFELPAPLTTALKSLARREGATLFMTLLAAFQVLLHRYSGQDDFAVGTPIAGRGHTELEGLIGLFVNTLVLRTDLSGNPAFRELLARVRETALSAYTHQDLPFEKLVEELAPARDLSRNPLFQVMFILQNAPGEELSLQDLEVSRLPLEDHSAKFDLTLSLRETNKGLQANWEYSSDLFNAATIERMAGHFRVLLEAIVADPEQRIGHLPLLTEVERHQLLVEWNDTAVEYPRDKCVHQLFEEQVERTPDAVAVVFEEEQLTYAELNTRANQLAHHLISLGVGPEVLVGICVDRSLDMVIGLLAILKADGAYVPLDPNYPQARLEFMLEDTQAPVLLTQQSLLGKLPPYEGRIVCLDGDWELIARQTNTNPPCHATSQNLAYVIFTSGSTGRPKGAMNEHRSVCNRLLWMQEEYGLGDADRVLQKTPFSFDVSVWEFFWPLLTGAPLIIARPDGHRDNEYLLSLIRDREITTLHFVPSMLRVFLEEEAVKSCPALRRVICSGEALDHDLQEHFFLLLPEVELHNLYGPTETAVDVTYWKCRSGNFHPTVPIGRPLANTQAYILDTGMNPVPVGVRGELHIGGVQVGRGYIGQPELTAERFVPDPFSGVSGSRLYKTGDLARYLPNGNIEFLGRIDDQVKIRGFRIELGEIESVLAEHPAIRQAAVLAREDAPGDKRLVAYVVTDVAGPFGEQAMRNWLGARLPQYMIPSHFVTLPVLPMAPHGKLDRKALPAPLMSQHREKDNFIPPRVDRERQVAGAFEKVLGVTPVSASGDFFDLGGHSLLVLTLLVEIEKRTGARLPVRAVFDFPTVEQLAALTRAPEMLSGLQLLVPLKPAGSKPPLFMTHAGVGADFFYRELLPHLPEDQPFYAIQPPGFDGKRPPCRSFEELAGCLIDEILAVQPHGPYSIGGVCLGGIIAWETARQLQARGHRVSSLLLFEAWAPQFEESESPAPLPSQEKQRGLALVRMKIDYHRNALALLSLREWPRYLLALGERIARKVGLLPAVAPVTRPHSQAMHDANHAITMSRKRYVPGTFSGQVDYFRAENQSVVGARPDLDWAELTEGKLHVHVVPGWHSNMLREPFVRALAPILHACLDRSEIDASAQQACSQNSEAPSGEATLGKTQLLLENT